MMLRNKRGQVQFLPKGGYAYGITFCPSVATIVLALFFAQLTRSIHTLNSQLLGCLCGR